MKKYIAVFLSIVVSLSLCACGSTDTKQDSINNEPDTSSKVEESTEKASNALKVVGDTTDTTMSEISTENDTFVEKLLSFGFTEDEAMENAKILRQCGIPNIDICEPTDANATIDGLVAYRGELDDDGTFWFTVDSRKIFYVSLNGEDLYDEDKGGYLKNFNDVHIPETYMSESIKLTLLHQTEPFLDKYFPYDTRYYDAWAVGREDNVYMVQCQISDGSILTDDWLFARVWYEQQEDGTFTPTGVEINGCPYAVKE